MKMNGWKIDIFWDNMFDVAVFVSQSILFLFSIGFGQIYEDEEK